VSQHSSVDCAFHSLVVHFITAVVNSDMPRHDVAFLLFH